MRIPRNAVVPKPKLRDYLLSRKEIDDKSIFLNSAGFSPDNWQDLELAILALAATTEAHEDGKSVYGTFWRNEGLLQGPLKPVAVVMIWIQWASDDSFHFVTLKPLRSRRS